VRRGWLGRTMNPIDPYLLNVWEERSPLGFQSVLADRLVKLLKNSLGKPGLDPVPVSKRVEGYPW
jgi:hypothetical protein